MAGLLHRRTQTDGRKQILQGAPPAHVHVYITAGHQGQAAGPRKRTHPFHLRRILRP